MLGILGIQYKMEIDTMNMRLTYSMPEVVYKL